MRTLLVSLLLLLVALQYKLWFGDGGLIVVWRLDEQIEKQRKENSNLTERNQALEAEVRDLKQGVAAIEERARSELGMIKKGESFFQVVDE